MRRFRVLAVVALLLTAVLLTGCLNKEWSYDFTATEASIDDWTLDSSGELYEFVEEGLSMNCAGIWTPFTFSGDMTILLDFILGVDEANYASLRISIEDGSLWDEENEIYLAFRCLGDPVYEEWGIDESSDGSGYCEYCEEGQVPGLNHNGENTLKVVKTGNQLTVYMNKTKLRTIKLEHFAGENNYIWLKTGKVGGEIILQRIEVKYSGEKTPGPVS
ncbi:MAG: hypothetical protein BWY00_01329 [Firmicutes bacterium ADurb.Bin153]|nr:MAG: hypothetical protein BWY00_01329 [Firmicutes bacterium ADurb.Bin153]